MFLPLFFLKFQFLREFCSVADPESGAFWPLDPGKVKNQDPDTGSGSGIYILDHICESLETIFLITILKFFNADPIRESF
jgi:hypothetical protein